jgi:hypothetical protein
LCFNVRSFAPSVIVYATPKLQFPSQLFINSNRSLKKKDRKFTFLYFWSSELHDQNYDKKDNVVPSYLKLENEN